MDREINLAAEMKKFYTLEECVDLFTVQEQLGEKDSWYDFEKINLNTSSYFRYCPQCEKHQRAFKKLDVWELPKILIIHLKRFQYSRYNRDKIDTEILIPTR